MKKIIGQPEKTNSKLIDLIKRTKINNYYIKNQKDFRNRIIEDIHKGNLRVLNSTINKGTIIEIIL